MNIGIVSYHKDPNYGTMLQAYALAYAIKREGVSCAYLDYRYKRKPFWHRWAVDILCALGLREKGEFSFFHAREFKRIREGFSVFHKRYIPHSITAYYADNIKQSLQEFDAFVVGSDQTWSQYMNRNPFSINFLQFVSDTSAKRAYAPSVGTVNIQPEYGEYMKKALSSFAHLSCRERQNCTYLSSLLNREVSYVLDPTLLLNQQDWDEIALSPELSKGSYVLAYILGEKECISQYAEMLGEKYHLPVYYVATRPVYLTKEKVLDAVGPQEFVGLVRDAACVVTDSFHGTLFSINYSVEFYSFAKRKSKPGEASNDNDRILAFLQELGLENRFKEDNNTTTALPIDYHAVHEKLGVLREESKTYLRKIIK